jgi:K+-transporting ATPase KdpF subunit
MMTQVDWPLLGLPAGTARPYARCPHDFVYLRLLCRGVSLRQGVPEVEVIPMQIDLITIAALILSVLLLGYLAFTLLYPEKF